MMKGIIRKTGSSISKGYRAARPAAGGLARIVKSEAHKLYGGGKGFTSDFSHAANSAAGGLAHIVNYNAHKLYDGGKGFVSGVGSYASSSFNSARGKDLVLPGYATLDEAITRMYVNSSGSREYNTGLYQLAAKVTEYKEMAKLQKRNGTAFGANAQLVRIGLEAERAYASNPNRNLGKLIGGIDAYLAGEQDTGMKSNYDSFHSAALAIAADTGSRSSERIQMDLAPSIGRYHTSLAPASGRFERAVQADHKGNISNLARRMVNLVW